MITDLEARKIASEWHGGGGTALYAFTSTGAIDTARGDHNAATEVDNAIADEVARRGGTFDGPDETNLWDLFDYIANTGTRGPVPGWSDLTW